MGTQFIHADSFSRICGTGKKSQNTISTITAEADREQGNCPHVENPLPPQVLYGCSFSEAGELAKKWAENSKDARGHALRKDALCFVAGVISAPDDLENWDKFKADSIEFLKKTYGKNLKSVIEHTDEPFKHIHFGVVAGQGERFEMIHQGYAAKLAADPNRGDKKRTKEQKAEGRKKGDRAYKDAMTEFGNSFYKEVSVNHGVARTGPRRRRMTRAEWKTEENQRKLLAEKGQSIAKKEVTLSEKMDNYNEFYDALGGEKAELENEKLAFKKEYAKFLDEKKAVEIKSGEVDKMLSDLEKREQDFVKAKGLPVSEVVKLQGDSEKLLGWRKKTIPDLEKHIADYTAVGAKTGLEYLEIMQKFEERQKAENQTKKTGRSH